MTIGQRLSEDIKTALKGGDKVTLSVLRMVLSEIKYAQAATGNVHEALPDPEALKVVAGYLKKLTKSLDDYPEGESRDKIKAEMLVVERYLPKRATEAEIATAVDQILANTKERNFGVLMKELMTKMGQSADGKQMSAILKQKISGS